MDSNTKLIGVFGDSYADPNPTKYLDKQAGIMPWMMHLEKIIGCPVYSYGLSATSIWYSYKKFLSLYKEYDTVIFCYSDLHRWYNINGEIHGGLYHIRYADQMQFVSAEFKQQAEVLVKAYEYLHDWDLDRFLFQSVFNSVNKLCDEAGITLINILNFEEINGTPLSIDISTTKNTVLTNLVQVSGREYLYQSGNGKFKDITELMIAEPDKRFCHLNPHNNKVLADIIVECIDRGPRHINLGNETAFSYKYQDIAYLLELD